MFIRENCIEIQLLKYVNKFMLKKYVCSLISETLNSQTLPLRFAGVVMWKHK